MRIGTWPNGRPRYATRSVEERDKTKVRAGMASARARWGEPRVVRLDGLTPEMRRAIVDLVEHFREVNRTGSDG